MALPVIIDCSDEQHTIYIEHGKRPWLDPEDDAHDEDLERSLAEMGGETSACIRFIDSWLRGGINALLFGEWGEDVVTAMDTEDAVAQYLAGERVEDHREIIVEVMANALAEAIKKDDKGVARDIAQYLITFLNIDDDVQLDKFALEHDDGDGRLTYHITWTLSIGTRLTGWIEVAAWKKVYERSTWDFFFFTPDEPSDWCEDVDSEFCTPGAVATVLEVFGLDDDITDDEVPEPYKPAKPCEDADDCEYAVLFTPADTSKGQFYEDFYRPIIVPYEDFRDAEWGMEHSIDLMRRDGEDKAWNATVVRRISDKEFDQLVFKLETEQGTLPLFHREVLGPTLIEQDLRLLQWKPWTREDEDEL